MSTLPAQLLDNFVLDESTAVYVAKGRNSEFLYSDGSEEKILEIVRSTADVSDGSGALLRSISDFPSKYHLSPERSALLWPLRNLLRGRVLEIGSGCGALTRFLGENGAEVLGVEGSPARAAICRERCRELQNVSVLAANIADLPSSEAFDTVLLIGVLEYSRMYLGGLTGPAELLEKCRALLKPQGVLIVAIENQLGLKYFAGAPEDHLLSPFLGIEDRYGVNSQVTFGRRELDELLDTNGFLYREFLYPFPDYKFPRAILPEAVLSQGDVNVASVLRMLAAPNQFNAYARTFSEEMAWPTILRNGLAPDLANSFLVVASPAASAQPEMERSICVFSTARCPAFAKVTVFLPQPGSEVHREHLHPGATAEGGPFIQRLENEPLFRGELLVEDFIRVLNRPGWTAEDLAQCSETWLAYLRKNAFSFADQANSTAMLPGEFLDCIPTNLVRDENCVVSRFDQEWIALQPISLAYVVFRGLLDALGRHQSIATPGDLEPPHTLAVLSRTLQLLGLISGDAGMEPLIQQEIALQSYVTGIPVETIAPAYPDLQTPPFRAVDLLQQAEALKKEAAAARRNRIEADALRTELHRALAEAASLQNAHEILRIEHEQLRTEAPQLLAASEEARKQAAALQIRTEQLQAEQDRLLAQLNEERTRNLALRVDLSEQRTEMDRPRNRAADPASLKLRLARLYHLILPRRSS